MSIITTLTNFFGYYFSNKTSEYTNSPIHPEDLGPLPQKDSNNLSSNHFSYQKQNHNYKFVTDSLKNRNKLPDAP